MEHIRLVNYEVGLPLPVITTPMNYLGEGGLRWQMTRSERFARSGMRFPPNTIHDVRKLVASLQKLENELRQSGKFRFASDVQKLGNAKTPKRQTTGKKRRVRS